MVLIVLVITTTGNTDPPKHGNTEVLNLQSTREPRARSRPVDVAGVAPECRGRAPVTLRRRQIASPNIPHIRGVLSVLSVYLRNFCSTDLSFSLFEFSSRPARCDFHDHTDNTDNTPLGSDTKNRQLGDCVAVPATKSQPRDPSRCCWPQEEIADIAAGRTVAAALIAAAPRPALADVVNHVALCNIRPLNAGQM